MSQLFDLIILNLCFSSTLLISLCAGLVFLLITAIILYFCICRRCIKNKRPFDDQKRTTTANRNSTNRIISSAASSSTTSSSLTTPIAVNIESSNGLLDDCHLHHLHNIHQVSSNQNHYNSSTTKSSQQKQQQQYLSSGSSNMNSNILINMNSISSANTTQTSLAANSNQLDNMADLEFNEQDEANEHDFILYTSNNLEFLKSHSLFNGKSPMNYYPSLTIRSSSM